MFHPDFRCTNPPPRSQGGCFYFQIPATRSVFGVRRRKACSRDAKRLWSAEIHLRFPVARGFYGWLCIALETGRAARRVTTFERKNRQAARRVVSTAPPACGWLRGTSRTSPGPPRRWRRPVRLRGTSARGRGFAAYLSACGGQPLNVRCAHYAGGASLSTFGFVTIVPRYFAAAK